MSSVVETSSLVKNIAWTGAAIAVTHAAYQWGQAGGEAKETAKKVNDCCCCVIL